MYDDKYGYISDSFSRYAQIFVMNNCVMLLNRNKFLFIFFRLYRSVGCEYEVKLKDYLTERNIAFCDENQLRTRGYDKTPDFKLEVPIAVNGFVVNWIESKARFGSEEVHDTTTKEQYLSYWNRFGTGLVIYWFDYVDTVAAKEQKEKKFIVMNHFPQNITYMDTKTLRCTETR